MLHAKYVLFVLATVERSNLCPSVIIVFKKQYAYFMKKYLYVAGAADCLKTCTYVLYVSTVKLLKAMLIFYYDVRYFNPSFLPI